MALLKNQQVAENTFVFIEDDAAIPASGDVIVTVDRWLKEEAHLSQHSGQVGVQINGQHDPRELGETLLERPLIALDFPQFRDGRNYTHARILREQLGFKGALRARGDVQRDQLYFMWRCGINEMELNANEDPEAARRAFGEFSVTYQPATDEPNPLFRRVS